MARSDEALKILETGPQNATYLQHDIQDNLIEAAAAILKQQISGEVSEASMYSLVADEARDCSHSENLSLVVRYVNETTIKESIPCLS